MPPIFVLTVDPVDGRRRQHCAALFRNLSMPFEMIAGFRADDPRNAQEYSPLRNLLFAKRSLTAAEIAVYLGHRRIWRTIVERGIAVALVVEDDLCIVDPDAFRIALAQAADNAAWDILKLFDFAPKKVVRRQAWNGLTLVDYKYPASGCVAYLVTREAAERLLARRKIFRPVDEDLSWCWEFDLTVRSILPNIVGETSHMLGGSLLEEGRLALRRRRRPVRSLIGMALAAIKQVRARRYLARVARRTQE